MTTKALWSWSGINAAGDLVQGSSWEIQRQRVLLALHQQHIHPISLKRQNVRSTLWRGEHSSEIIRQLATLLQAGLTLPESLILLSQQQSTLQWRALLHTLAEKLEQGQTFSDAMAQ